GMGGLDELGLDPEPEPPDAELGEAAEGAGGERRTVVAAEPLGQAVLAEETLEDRSTRRVARCRESLTGEQVARVAVDDGERVAAAAIADGEVPLEVGGPDRVWRVHRRGGTARMPERTPAPARMHEPMRPQERADGARRRPRCPGL